MSKVNIQECWTLPYYNIENSKSISRVSQLSQRSHRELRVHHVSSPCYDICKRGAKLTWTVEAVTAYDVIKSDIVHARPYSFSTISLLYIYTQMLQTIALVRTCIRRLMKSYYKLPLSAKVLTTRQRNRPTRTGSLGIYYAVTTSEYEFIVRTNHRNPAFINKSDLSGVINKSYSCNHLTSVLNIQRGSINKSQSQFTMLPILQKEDQKLLIIKQYYRSPSIPIHYPFNIPHEKYANITANTMALQAILK